LFGSPPEPCPAPVEQRNFAEFLAGKKILHSEHSAATFAKAERKTKAQQDGLFQP